VDASAQSTPALPGALGHRRDPDALLDHRYLWDLEGNLLLQEANDGTSTYAYDAQNRLIVSATALKANRTPPVLSVSRYAYGGVMPRAPRPRGRFGNTSRFSTTASGATRALATSPLPDLLKVSAK
jgi:YD repeat-containing protein